MSLLGHPDAQAPLDDATGTPEAVEACQGRLTTCLQRYLPPCYRVEHRAHAATVIRGLRSDPERKTGEPIASQAGLHRTTLRTFVGSGAWDAEAVMTELRHQVRHDLAEPDGGVVSDPSGFPRRGTESCGVARQWCGRRGKVEHGQVGACLAYATRDGDAPLDRRLYWPEDWADDPVRREKCHVPKAVPSQETWQIAPDLLDRSLPGLAHGWITGDDELGRPTAFRAALRGRHERYVLDVPWHTTARDLERRRPPRKRAGVGRKREVPLVRADVWAQNQPESPWERITVGAGEEGPLEVEAMTVRVRAQGQGRIGPGERLIVIRSVGETRIDYALSDAGPEVPLAELVRVQRQRHGIEGHFAAGNGEVGLDHYEVRSWVGRHHHMTSALVASGFVCLERRPLGGEHPGHHGVADAADLHAVAPAPGAESIRDRRGDHAGVAAY